MQDQFISDFWGNVVKLKRWLWLLILAAVLGAGAGYGFSHWQVPIYQATTTLLIDTAPTANTGTDYSSVLASQQVAQTYSQLLTQRLVLEQVLPTLPYSISIDDFKKKIAVNVVQRTQLIKVTVEDPSPVLAAQIANNLATVFADQVQNMQSDRYKASKDGLQAQMSNLDYQIQQLRKDLTVLAPADANKDQRDRLQAMVVQYQQSYNSLLQSYEQINFAEAQGSSNVKQVDSAAVPNEPVRPIIPLYTALAGVVGLLLALAAVSTVEMLDDTLKSPVQITGEGEGALPVLGFIPYIGPGDAHILPVTAAQPRSPIAERFRVLRTNIQYTHVDKPLHTILVTSPAPGDGKTTVAANLAVAIAQDGKTVALLDADLRRPSLHTKLDFDNGAGVSSLFTLPQLHLNGNLRSTGLPGLSLMTSGELPPNPSELLGSRKMQDILRLVQAQNDLVILDSPPITSVTDAVVLSRSVDGVVLVVRLGMTKLTACREAIAELQHAGANVLGLVINAVKPNDARYYNHYFYYRDYKQEDSLRARLARRLGLWRSHPRTRTAAAIETNAWTAAVTQHGREGEGH